MFDGKHGFGLAILTTSDAGAKGEREDTSGELVSEKMVEIGFFPKFRVVLPDEMELISRKLVEWCDSGDVDLVLTTGGTGLGSRDVTPEATRAVIEFEVPGIAEAIRTQTFENTPLSMLSRSVSGVRSGCLIINLPGNPSGVRECLDVLVPVIVHAIEILKGRRGHPTH